jgi:hypothetical protein
MFVEAERRHRAVLELFGEIGEERPVPHPVVEGSLQRRHDREGIGGAGEVPGDDNQPTVAAVLQRC